MDGTGIDDLAAPGATAAPLVVVTGASGFIGRHLVRTLHGSGFRVRAVTRQAHRQAAQTVADIGEVPHPGVAADADWAPLLAGADAVVHLAGLAHLPLDTREMRHRLRNVNVLATQRLGKAAADAGIATFIFMSSIKAVSDHSTDTVLTETSVPRPEDCYGVAKRATERRLERIAAAAPGMRLLILRPPLVYGPGVGANFAALARLVGRGLPLPLGAVHNRRSLIYVGNLAAAVVRCLQRPQVGAGTFHLSDGAAVSTPDLIRAIAKAQGSPARLTGVPLRLLALAARVLRRQAQFERVAGSLEVSNRHFCRSFDWQPPYSMEEGLRETLRPQR
jgi:nucleoside-diphosphate-sugar epimerase